MALGHRFPPKLRVVLGSSLAAITFEDVRTIAIFPMVGPDYIDTRYHLTGLK